MILFLRRVFFTLLLYWVLHCTTYKYVSRLPMKVNRTSWKWKIVRKDLVQFGQLFKNGFTWWHNSKDSFRKGWKERVIKVWPDLAKVRQFCQKLKDLNFLGFVEYLSKKWTNFGKVCMVLGPFFVVANGQILKNDLIIWSNCRLFALFANGILHTR